MYIHTYICINTYASFHGRERERGREGGRERKKRDMNSCKYIEYMYIHIYICINTYASFHGR